jgi:antitoxin (DNA-binding transcriptional repressor) of toxin-antitoxin stability system
MKTINIESLDTDVRSFISSAQNGRILVTQEGKPIALLVGLENKDREGWELENSPEFWRMIEERRREPALPWKDVKDSFLHADV